MKYLKDQRGLTLVETIVALVLVLLLVAAFAGALTAGLQREIEVDHSLKAADLSASIIEYFGDNRDFLPANEGAEISLSNFNNLNDAAEDDLIFNSLNKDSSTITITRSEGYDNLYIIKLYIEWHEPQRDSFYELVSYLTGPDGDFQEGD